MFNVKEMKIMELPSIVPQKAMAVLKKTEKRG